MPGPSQAGKFKPRKPAKKIRVGAAAAASVVPDAAASAASAAANASTGASQQSQQQQQQQSGTTLAGHGGGGQYGSGGPGRGGGRGGGRKLRAPLPQGQVFFTAAPPPGKKGSASKGGSGGGGGSGKSGGTSGGTSSSSSKLLIQKKDTEASEEVVGQLDKAIGSSFGEDGTSTARASTRDMAEDYVNVPSQFDDDGGGASGGKRYFTEEGCTYDSDSSLEEAKPRPPSTTIPPLRLPFPVAPLPVGIGSASRERPFSYDDQQTDNAVAETTRERPITASTMESSDLEMTQKPSPFVDPKNVNDLQWEMDHLFLFQLPTRLPPLAQHSSTTTAGNSATTTTTTTTIIKDENATHEDDHDDDHEEGDVVMEDAPTTIPAQQSQQQPISDVVTNPLLANAFDNALATARPGKLGRLVVYKSGKTVLHLEQPQGETIPFLVTEGLTCGFAQQAVLMDPQRGLYIPLGHVHKTAVVSACIDGGVN